MKKSTSNNQDLWRKRVMAAIGGWLTNMKTEHSATLIKSIACRAAGVDDFNKIPLSKLRAVYYEFVNRQNVAANSSILKDLLTFNLN